MLVHHLTGVAVGWLIRHVPILRPGIPAINRIRDHVDRACDPVTQPPCSIRASNSRDCSRRPTSPHGACGAVVDEQ